MFEIFLSSIPKNRLEIVNELELPDDIELSPFFWTDLEDSQTVREKEDSLTNASANENADDDFTSISTDSSMPLSRALTDSEIDYQMYKQYKRKSISDPWQLLREALNAFPIEYLELLNRYNNPDGIEEDIDNSRCPQRSSTHIAELRSKMELFFEEECQVFLPGDPGLVILENALASIDYKDLDLDLEII